MLKMFKRKEEEGAQICNFCKTEFPDRAHLEKHKKIAHAKGR